ncbi:MAG: ribulose-phosphate 3-epimerase [Candidatus Marinimicrobia bacterium]|jgi:ribulose-phosphate 3-epimerase|nr:ribulose-phosphate 3-epimerase [Candidatus Neomarinimicrobiota bacterium]MDP6852370.1 ribulose-phosphate 3-epimerase [Candidatus Neomarinimicrobiota bacterium]
MRVISPSLLSADFKHIQKDIEIVETAGATRLHLDVMDGHFVPNLTFGPFIIHFIRQCTSCHLETHLMIDNPAASFDQYIKAGSDTIIFHIEASGNPLEELKYLKSNGVSAGIALNPDTDINKIVPLIDDVDYLLIMSVFPGKGGQSFIRSTLDKMRSAVTIRENRNITIGVDGGVNLSTINEVFATGIDVTIVGSGLFNSDDISTRFQELLNA